MTTMSQEHTDANQTRDAAAAAGLTLRAPLQLAAGGGEDLAHRLVEGAALFPKEVAQRVQAVLLERTGRRRFVVGMTDPTSLEATDEVARALNTSTQAIDFQEISGDEFERLFALAYAPSDQEDERDEVAAARQGTVWKDEGAAAGAARREEPPDSGSEIVQALERADTSRPWELTNREFIHHVLIRAVRARASDIHVEATDEGGVIRFRCDGTLSTIWSGIPVERAKELVNAIAMEGRVLPTELVKRPYQSVIEKSIKHRGVTKRVEFRVEFLPTKPFPEAVMRVGTDPINRIELIGLLPRQLEESHMGISLDSGMSVVTGGTGSGKSVTMLCFYEIWQQDPRIKIIELADPIEYVSARRTQIPITPFCSWMDGLTAALRSDPDVIAVGECRDSNVMKVALHAATSGHRVPTTLHTNDVASTFTRIRRMNVPPSIMADALNLIVSQKLVRKLCDHCKVIDEPRSVAANHPIYAAKGCLHCYGQGYRGRTAIAEVLFIRPEIRHMIGRGMKGRDIVKEAVLRGWMMPMEEAAAEKLKSGVTSFIEVESAVNMRVDYDAETFSPLHVRDERGGSGRGARNGREGGPERTDVHEEERPWFDVDAEVLDADEV